MSSLKDCISISVFDIFKAGPGPSSSHTIGPMRASLLFREEMETLDPPLKDLDLKVHLFGSLSLTGMGHGTHRAILGGLLGWEPETCDCDALNGLLKSLDTVYDLPLGSGYIRFSGRDIIFENQEGSNLPFANTLRFILRYKDRLILEKEYYSIGGGFIQCKGEVLEKPLSPPHLYWNMTSLQELIRKTGLSLEQVVLENESALTGKDKADIQKQTDHILDAMHDSVANGLSKDGLLPGSIGLHRKAKVLRENALKMSKESGRFLGLLNAYAMAASEENADGRRVVTAPTSGASGVLPGVVYMLKHHHGLDRNQLRKGLLAAAVVAFIAKKNASISGAEVGCQGEVGVASSMAAAFMTHAMGGDMKRLENAAEIALEHQLGMTCDPVGGYVQIPCIERNAVGAVTAVNAHILADAGDPDRQKVSFDEVVQTMMETGKDMNTRYKETSLGGLALCYVNC
ncbi:MAG: L-serine ammonia-lyase [Desulfobacteraceae bacterium]|nr:MAG: L-serine ammonia-lyase [Desulfobacteraceae bacterium]